MENQESHQPSKAPKSGVSLVTVTIAVFLALVIGIVVGQRSDQLLGTIFHQQKATNTGQLDTDSLQQTYQSLAKKYDGKLDRNQLIEGASRGLVEAAGDPYTVYFNKNEAKEFSADLDGTFSGIGAELGKQNDKLIVISPLDDSPAAAAGLKPNDIIARVNGEDTSGWSIDKVVSKIKGKQGTTVKLTIVRQDEVKDLSITRAVITNPSVKTEKKGDIGVIRISRFGEDSASLVRKAAQEFQDAHVKGVVVDVRDNGGGYLASAQEIASIWLDAGQTVVTERVGDKVTETHRSNGEATLKGVPTVVLINGASASASEILAGALQDHGVAKLVGEKSFGKGSVQQLVNLNGGSELKVTVARWYTPKGNSINKKGIAPDVTIKPAEGDNGRDKDAQLTKALELIK